MLEPPTEAQLAAIERWHYPDGSAAEPRPRPCHTCGVAYPCVVAWLVAHVRGLQATVAVLAAELEAERATHGADRRDS
jgi:hypothetical protein